MRRRAPNTPLLSLDNPSAALDRTGLQPATGSHEPLWEYFLWPALILLLLSVAVRRLAFNFRSRK